ncbi:hypothetical protein HMPREF1255_1627 [Propionimicrobium sp. BV2F7]|nr:hypothetical protein HMPREF1255_1627 [Propionimicrobium sp. BV2F7]
MDANDGLVGANTWFDLVLANFLTAKLSKGYCRRSFALKANAARNISMPRRQKVDPTSRLRVF